MNYKQDYDICGWAVIDNMVARKGTVFKPGSLVKASHQIVPVIFGKEYEEHNVVGTALLEAVDGGIYFYGTATEPMLDMIHSGKIQTVSIFANDILYDDDRNVIKGTIRSLELVKYEGLPTEFRDTKIEKWKYEGKSYRRDATCRLRQVKEDMNSALQHEFQEKDDRYREGLKDLYKALCIIASESSNKGMSVLELDDIFGCRSVCSIILGNTPEEIIDKVNQWKAEKDKEEREFHVGDEVDVDHKLIGIIIDAYDNGVIWVTYRITPAARGLDCCWVNKAECKKTGRHFDSIPFDYNPEKEEE